MDIPSFEEFMETIGSDTVTVKVREHLEEIPASQSILTEQGLADFSLRIIHASLATSIDVLSDYHRWISKYIQQLGH